MYGEKGKAKGTPGLETVTIIVAVTGEPYDPRTERVGGENRMRCQSDCYRKTEARNEEKAPDGRNVSRV